VAQLLSERFDRPISIDADPKAVIALGAARMLAERADSESARSAVIDGAEASASSDRNDADPDAAHAPAKRRRWRIPTVVPVTGGSLVLALGIVAGSATPLAVSDLSADAR